MKWQWGLCALFFSLPAMAESSLSTLKKQLATNNPELRASSSRQQAQKNLAHSQWSPFLPELSAAAGYAKENTLHDKDDGYVGYLSGRWNLFRGGQDWKEKGIADQESRVADLDHDITSRRLNRELGEAYYEALLNTHFISVDSEKIQFLHNQRSMAQKKINAGLTSNVDAIELDLEESTLSAEIESHKTDLQISQDVIKSLVYSDSVTNLSTKEAFPRISEADFAKTDVSQNPALQKQQALEQSSHLRRQKAQGAYLPSIDLNAQYGRLVPQYEDPMDGTESRVSVLMTWTFFSGLDTRFKTAAAKELETSQGFEKANTQIQLNTQTESLRNKARELLALRSLLEKRQTLTQKYYDLTLSEYRRGIKNSSDLASATNSLFENRTRLLQVQKDLAVLKLKFDELTM
ncbi:TolC family protein [Bdellovibrio bacteriovorus]|uniref:HAS ABC exporter outer membrane component n=1 Tax=Bdellovibrio bacteriovorus str. Tiberius TaxID=1069642 RepID=K7YPV6_BDEBC|nr:TolC family protein [Bdellovibrio bacteriovorus]AFY01866.1 HAS ABC exporter outer membrane component [Bdellovibrio bacteriovorus str. Tiberius]